MYGFRKLTMHSLVNNLMPNLYLQTRIITQCKVYMKAVINLYRGIKAVVDQWYSSIF